MEWIWCLTRLDLPYRQANQRDSGPVSVSRTLKDLAGQSFLSSVWLMSRLSDSDISRIGAGWQGEVPLFFSQMPRELRDITRLGA